MFTRTAVSFACLALAACGSDSSNDNKPSPGDSADNRTGSGVQVEATPTEPTPTEATPTDQTPTESTVSAKPEPETPVVATALPVANTLALTLSDSRSFNFSWRPQKNLSHYRLFGKTAAAEGFTQVGADISNLDIGLSLQVALVDQVNAQYKLQ